VNNQFQVLVTTVVRTCSAEGGRAVATVVVKFSVESTALHAVAVINAASSDSYDQHALYLGGE